VNARATAAALGLALAAGAAAGCKQGEEPRRDREAGAPGLESSSKAAAGAVGAPAAGADAVEVFSLPPNHLYPGHRAPLASSPFSPLPPAAIRPARWLLERLERQLERLRDPRFAGGALDEAIEKRSLILAAALLRDGDAAAAAARWAETAMQRQDADGWLGPDGDKPRFDWRPGLAIAIALREHHAVSGDASAIDAVRRFFRFQAAYIGAPRLAASLGPRAGAALELLHWLYDQTGEAEWLELARSASSEPPGSALGEDAGAEWTAALRSSAAACFGGGGAGRIEATDAAWRRAAGDDRAVAAIENAAFQERRELLEMGLCDLAEAVDALTLMARLAEDSRWGDRLERLVLNELASAFSSDGAPIARTIRALQIDAPGVEAAGDDAQACSAAAAGLAWPLFARRLWMAAPGDGLAAVAYAPCEVSARVGDDEGTEIVIVVETQYPFEDSVRLRIRAPRPARFPLVLRIPAWAAGASAAVNDGAPASAKAGSYLGLSREWRDGDAVLLRLPMRARLERRFRNAVSVAAGPLIFALDLDRPGADSAAPWSYVLSIDRFFQPEASLRLSSSAGEPAGAAPGPSRIRIAASARLAPSWKAAADAIEEMPQSPVLENRLDDESVALELVPFAETRRRIAVFPWTASR
jgi:hypothetical protein